MNSSISYCILYSRWIHPSRKVNVRGITYTAPHHPFRSPTPDARRSDPASIVSRCIGSSIRIQIGQFVP